MTVENARRNTSIDNYTPNGSTDLYKELTFKKTIPVGLRQNFTKTYRSDKSTK